MANIFGGVEPPSWLQAIAQPPPRGETGASFGTLAAGLFNSFQRNPGKEIVAHDKATGEMVPTGTYEKGPRKGFLQGYHEARMNQMDPMWKLRKAQSEAIISGELARAEAANALAQARTSENAAIAEDIPKLAPWLQDTNQPVPELRSRYATDVVQKTIHSSAANRIAANGAKAWTTMLNNLTNKGGMHAVVAGRYAQFLEQVPPPEVMEQFGKDIAQLGVTESELAQSAGPVTSVTQGTRGMVVKREQPLIDAKAAAAMNVNAQQGTINAERDSAKFGFQKDLETQKFQQNTQLLDKRVQGQQTLQEQKAEQAQALEAQRQQGREKLAGMKEDTAKAIASVKSQPSYYSARAKILAKSLEIAQQEAVDNPDDEDAKSTLLDLERQFLDLYTKQRKEGTTGTNFTPAGQPQKIGRFTVTPGK